VIAIMNCAGPYSQTFKAISSACLRNHVHYLDITGEIDVFEAAAKLSDKAKEAKIMILPGTGLDVVPSDCLAMRLKKQLPTATELSLAFGPITKGGSAPSRGTLRTMIESLGKPFWVRRDGEIKESKYLQKTFLFPGEAEGTLKTKTGAHIPWGDVSTAYHSTQIPNITVYAPMPVVGRWGLWFYSFRPVRFVAGLASPLLNYLVPEGGPSAKVRESTRMGFWGQVVDKQGQKAEAVLRTPEGYKLTALTSVHILSRVLKGDAPTGFQTPSMAYGADLITEVDPKLMQFEDITTKGSK